MKLLIGTYHNLLLYDDGMLTLVRPGVHYGITWDHEHIYASYNPPDRNVTEIEIYDRDLNYLGVIPDTELQGVHQIHWRDRLYITNTEHTRIEVWDGECMGSISWADQVDGRPNDVDRLHINSLWFDGEHWLVCEHGYRYPPAKVRVFDQDWQMLSTVGFDWLERLDTNAHNIYLEGNVLYVCLHQRIMLIDWYTKLPIKYVYPHGDDSNFLLRGLARTPDHFLVGESTYAPRDQRSDGDVDVLIMDSDMCVVDNILLRDTGQVYEVRVVDEEDRAHNGIQCPMMR